MNCCNKDCLAEIVEKMHCGIIMDCCDSRACEKFVPPTNADRIRSMTDGELLNFLWYFDLANVAVEKSRHKILKIRLQDWLNQSCQEDTEELYE